MSQQATQPQKPNFMTMLLMMLVVFMGLQLFFAPQRGQQQQAPPKQVDAVAEAQKIGDKDPADADDIKKQLDTIHPSGMFVSLTHWWEGVTGNRQPENVDAFKVWLLYANALYIKGYQKSDKRDGNYELAEQQYEAMQKEMPKTYAELVGPDKLPLMQKELDKRYQSGIGYQIIDTLVRATGSIPWLSYALAPLLLAIGVRILLWPFSHASFKMMRQVNALKPLTDKLKERYEGQELMQKQAEVMKKAGVNQISGCLAMMAPLPFLFWLYSAMRAYRFHFQDGVFAWINPVASHATHGFVAPNLGMHDNILLALYAVSMFISQRMMVMDPTAAQSQAKTSMMMTAVITVMMFMWQLPSAFVLYWLSFNVLSTIQQLWVNKQPIPAFDIELPELIDGSNGKGKGVPKQHKPKSGPGAAAKKRRR